MIVMPPLPKRQDEMLKFLVEVAHIVNNGEAGSIAARVYYKDIVVKSCATMYNDDYDEMDFVVNGTDDTTEPLWRARISHIGIDSFSNGFWLELTTVSGPRIVLHEHS